MQCPTDGTELRMTERQGVEIDYCPTCRGVWLDRGELDKIIERSATAGRYDDDDDDRYRPRRDDYPAGHEGGYPKRKKKSMLSELFDF